MSNTNFWYLYIFFSKIKKNILKTIIKFIINYNKNKNVQFSELFFEKENANAKNFPKLLKKFSTVLKNQEKKNFERKKFLYV